MPAGRILIVEDNSYGLELMSYLLSAHGYRVHGARTAAGALTLVASEPVDLVLLDLQLPDLDGYQVLPLLRRERRLIGVAIIAVTAVAMVGDRERTLTAGFDHYMPKPINPRTFVMEVCNWLPAAARH
jgi:CheY-like chemotaxis protein